MCGIYGFAGLPTTKTAKALSLLAVLNESRGRDSAGMAFVSHNRLQIIKNTGTSSQLLLKHKPMRYLWQLGTRQPMAVIGHTRQATHGAVNQENAHPYLKQGIVWAHNGILQNHDKLAQELGAEIAVDSQIIGELLVKYTAQQALEQHLAGSYAIPWVNTREQAILNLARNSNPISFAIRPDRLQFYYSSTAQDLELALEYAGLRLPINTSAEGRIYSLVWQDRLYLDKQDFIAKHYEYSYGLGLGTGYTQPDKNLYAYDGYSTGNWNWEQPIAKYNRTIKNGRIYLTPKHKRKHKQPTLAQSCMAKV